MKKILSLLFVMLLLFVFIGCDDTSDSPEMSAMEAENVNNEFTYAALNFLDTSFSSALSSGESSFDLASETATYITSGEASKNDDNSWDIELKIEMTDYETSSAKITEGTINYDGTISTSMKISGTLKGDFRFDYKDNPYKCSWDFEIEDNKYTGEYDMNGTDYTFDKTLDFAEKKRLDQ